MLHLRNRYEDSSAHSSLSIESESGYKVHPDQFLYISAPNYILIRSIFLNAG